MPKSNNLSVFIVLVFALAIESAQSSMPGFYLAPAVVSIIFFFLSPFIVRSLNAFLAGFCGFLALCAWQWGILYFTIPYFLILSLILYVFSEK